MAALLGSVAIVAQVNPGLKTSINKLDKKQSGFSSKLSGYPLGKPGKDQLKRFIGTETDSIQQLIVNDPTMALSQKILALDCQSYLLDTLQSSLGNRAFNINLLSDSRESFIPLWQLVARQRSCEAIMKPFKPQTAGFMAAVFKPFPRSDQLKEIADLKLMEQHPELIIPFLSSDIHFGYRDSLIFILANTQPEKLLRALADSRNEDLKRVIRQNSYPLVQTLVGLSSLKDQSLYLPFLPQMADGRMTMPEIEALRAQPCAYFMRLVDAEMNGQNRSLAGNKPSYAVPLKNYLKEYSIRFFTDIINMLHDETREKDRYFVLDDLRPQDLYYIITNGENDLYTSSYLYTYKKLMGMMGDPGADSLLRLVQFDQYRKFLLMAGRYNTLVPFLRQLSDKKMMDMVGKMMAGLENADIDDLEDLINVAESFPGLVNDASLFRLAAAEISKNQLRCRDLGNTRGIKAYTLLNDLLNTIRAQQEDPPSPGLPLFAQYYGIPYRQLQEPDGSIHEMALFYGDEDGKQSFSSFMGHFTDGGKWSVERNEYWVKIRSNGPNPLTIFANLPLPEEEKQDEKARDSLSLYLKDNGIYPRVLILRGHSYHMHESFNQLHRNTKLVIMGSCGSYTEIADILAKSPEAQVISSKQMGSMLVNEPVISLLNDKLTSQLDLHWPAIWQDLESRFNSNKTLYDYFKAYIPPYKNIAQMAITRYKQLNEQ